MEAISPYIVEIQSRSCLKLLVCFLYQFLFRGITLFFSSSDFLKYIINYAALYISFALNSLIVLVPISHRLLE